MTASIVPRALIVGCAGTRLSESERRFFAAADPLGFILFGRNCRTREQVRDLVADFRAAVGRADAPVLIDQEGGRVARLKPPQWRSAPTAAAFGDLARRDLGAAREAAYLNARLIAADLADLGIDVDTLPVLDIPAAGADPIIGDRAFSDDPDIVAALGRATCEGLMEGGILPVIKHVPGHGRAMVDSHQALPVVAADVEDLKRKDFAPFRALADMPWAMTAHVVYRAIDPDRAATVSPEVVAAVIRGFIGFDGVLLSDDISMNALSGTIGERAAAALEAGCDVVLHCNGDRSEMEEVADMVGPLSAASRERLARPVVIGAASAPFDRAEAEARFGALMGVRP